MDQAALEKLQESMEALLQQNKDMNDKITKLQEENENIRKTRETTDERVSRNVRVSRKPTHRLRSHWER